MSAKTSKHMLPQMWWGCSLPPLERAALWPLGQEDFADWSVGIHAHWVKRRACGMARTFIQCSSTRCGALKLQEVLWLTDWITTSGGSLLTEFQIYFPDYSGLSGWCWVFFSVCSSMAFVFLGVCVLSSLCFCVVVSALFVCLVSFCVLWVGGHLRALLISNVPQWPHRGSRLCWSLIGRTAASAGGDLGRPLECSGGHYARPMLILLACSRR